MAKFKEFRRGYQPWEHEGGGSGAMGGGGDLHASALDHDFVSTVGGPGYGPADQWEGLAEILDETHFGTEHLDRTSLAVATWLKKEHVKSVLEVGSGLGHTTWRLVKEGLKVTAVESSPSLLARTRANAKGAKAEESDFVDLPAGPFDAVVSMRNAYSRLLPEGQAADMLASVRSRLKKGGLFSVAFFNRDALDEQRLNRVFPSDPVTYKGKRTIFYDQWQGHPDGGDRLIWAPLVMIGDYSIDWVRRSIPFKYWRIAEVKAALSQAGFEVLATLDASDGKTPAGPSTRRVEIRARAK